MSSDPEQEGKSQHVAHAQGWKAICTAPDFCKVGKVVVAFNSFATLDLERSASPNVKARGTSVYRQGDVIRNIQGDAGKHVVSGTALAQGFVKVLEGHQSVQVNGRPIARHDSRCLINCDSHGVGGAAGKLVTTEKAKLKAQGGTVAITASPKRLNALKDLRSKLRQSMLPVDAAEKFVDFDTTNQVLSELIGSMHGVPGTLSDYKIQASRAVLGFTKDIVLDSGELAYEAAKELPKLAERVLTSRGQMLTAVEAQIVVESIRGGSVFPNSIKEAIKGAGTGLLEPVTDPWARGQYVEAVTRAAAEVGTLGLGLLKGGKLTSLRKVSSETSPGAAALSTNGVHIRKATKPGFSGDWSDYTTLGLDANPIKSAEGRKLVAELESRGLSRGEALDEASDLMRSGSTYPMANPVEVGDKFYKILDETGEVGPNSAFWVTEKQLSELKGLSYDQVADKLGMPLASQQGNTFKVMEVTAFRPTTSFSSVIAPTSEVGKGGVLWSQKGGGVQTLLTDRSAFTTPKSTNIRLP